MSTPGPDIRIDPGSGPGGAAVGAAIDSGTDVAIDTGATQVLRRPSSAAFTPVTLPRGAAAGEPSAEVTGWGGLPMFEGLDADVLAQVGAAMTPVRFAAGEALLTQGDVGDDMFVIEDGTVTVVVRDAEGAIAFERVMAGPTVLGEMALVTREPRSATVTADTEVRALRMTRAVFDELSASHPRAAVFLTCLVGERLLEAKGIRKVGKYEVLGRLGSGGMATVFEAMHPGLGRSVALKMLSHALVFDPGFAEHFGREGRLVAQLNHDNIVRVLDTEQAYGTHFIVMEKLSGDLLEGLVRRREPIDWSAARRILAEIAAALAYSHERGLIHRDIKPANVFMTEDKRVKLLDFGIAVDVGRATDQDGMVVGTPFYMSPEQITGQPLDGRSDQYSLGILAYELCTHQLPFLADTAQGVFALHLAMDVPDPRLLVPGVPDDLVEFIRIATAKKPADRFADCHEAAAFLLRSAQAPTVDPAEMSTLALSYLPSRRAQVQAILAEATEKLRRLHGVAVFQAHQIVAGPPVGAPQAPTAAAVEPKRRKT